MEIFLVSFLDGKQRTKQKILDAAAKKHAKTMQWVVKFIEIKILAIYHTAVKF